MDLHQQAAELFADMGLDGAALAAAWDAFATHPEGTVKVALGSFGAHVNSPAQLFGWFLRRGEHERAQLNGHRRTGFSWKRGTHSGTYVRDPRGTDPLPPYYDLGRSGW